MSKLKEINISHNILNDLPLTVVALSNLEILVVDGNPFKHIPDHVEKRGVPIWEYLLAKANDLADQL